MNTSHARFLLLGLGVVGLGIVLGTALWLRLGPPSQFGQPVPSAAGLNRYGTVPDFVLTDRSGGTVTLAQLQGKIWIANFIYTTCTDTCPLQTAMMAKLQEQYAGDLDIQLVSITVDPESDTPEVLSLYADKYQADPKRWYFLTGPRDRIVQLVQQGFHLAVSAVPAADPGGMIPHSPRFVLVDKKAQIRGYYDSREADALARIKSAIDSLVKG